MVIQINREESDTVETAATAAVNVATLLNVNTLFYWDGLPYEVKPGSNAAILAQTINNNMATKAAKAKDGK